MINLLPAEKKAELRAARTNTIIARYTWIVVAALVFCAGVLYYSHTILTKTAESAKNRAATATAENGGLDTTSTDSQLLSSKLSDAASTFSQEVQYSALLTKLGAALPANTILDSIDITEASFGSTPLSLRIYAKSTADTTSLVQKLQASQLFTQVAVQSTDQTTGIDGYPVTVTLSATLSRTGGR